MRLFDSVVLGFFCYLSGVLVYTPSVHSARLDISVWGALQFLLSCTQGVEQRATMSATCLTSDISALSHDSFVTNEFVSLILDASAIVQDFSYTFSRTKCELKGCRFAPCNVLCAHAVFDMWQMRCRSAADFSATHVMRVHISR